MKKSQKTPQWIVAKRVRRAAKKNKNKYVKSHGTRLIKYSK